MNYERVCWDELAVGDLFSHDPKFQTVWRVVDSRPTTHYTNIDCTRVTSICVLGDQLDEVHGVTWESDKMCSRILDEPVSEPDMEAARQRLLELT